MRFQSTKQTQTSFKYDIEHQLEKFYLMNCYSSVKNISSINEFDGFLTCVPSSLVYKMRIFHEGDIQEDR